MRVGFDWRVRYGAADIHGAVAALAAADEEGAAKCSSCAAGKYLQVDGTAEYHDEEADCEICEAGTYSGLNASSCISCPTGKYLDSHGGTGASIRSSRDE